MLLVAALLGAAAARRDILQKKKPKAVSAQCCSCAIWVAQQRLQRHSLQSSMASEILLACDISV